jgi:L-alanine-DL-glutamate epimerase-like enolase superfamily enzyme
VTFTLRLRTLQLPLRDPFIIARSSHGEGRSVTTVVATLRDDADGADGPIGIGEGYPDPFYGDTPETMAAIAPRLLAALEPIEGDLRGGVDDVRAALEDAEGLMAATVAHHGALKCALDIALHDFAGKRLGLPVRELLAISGDVPPTDFTLGIDVPEIVADESAVTIEDLDALVGVVAGVNVKLAKCGGIGPARRMLERSRELGLRTFLGCMEETSIGIAASAVVSPLAEWVDLDGCLLLADDPVTGLELGPDKRWRLADAPGLGLSLGASSTP